MTETSELEKQMLALRDLASKHGVEVEFGQAQKQGRVWHFGTLTLPLKKGAPRSETRKTEGFYPEHVVRGLHTELIGYLRQQEGVEEQKRARAEMEAFVRAVARDEVLKTLEESGVTDALREMGYAPKEEKQPG